jgi:hypothetical protein
MGSPDTKGVLTPSANTAWKLMLLVASIAVGSIEAYKIILPPNKDPGGQVHIQNTQVIQDIQNTILARRIELDRLTVAMTETQEKLKGFETEKTKLTDQVTQIRIRMAACRCAYSPNDNQLQNQSP